jgi:hypothetical protein
MNKPLITYIIIVIISFTNDKLHSECNNPNIKVDMVSLLHHFVSIYSWFGTFIFGYPEIHLFYVLAIIAGWNYFGNCVISEWYNNACELDKNKNHKDIPYYIMSTITGNERQSYSYLIYAVVAIDIGLIFCKYRHSLF